MNPNIQAALGLGYLQKARVCAKKPKQANHDRRQKCFIAVPDPHSCRQGKKPTKSSWSTVFQFSPMKFPQKLEKITVEPEYVNTSTVKRISKS